MTEYDYSPDAVERYYAKLNSVAKWVDHQHYESPGYKNPFVQTPSEVGRKQNAFYTPNPRDSHRSASPSTGYRTSVPTAYRTGCERERGRSGESEYYRTHASNASSATLVQSQARYGSGSGSSTPHRSKSQPRSEHKRPQTSRSVSTTVPYDKPVRASYDQPPVRSQTLPAQYNQSGQTPYTSAPGQTVVMKHGKQTYVVVPPYGGRVEVRSQNTSPTYAAPAPMHTQAYPQAQANVVYAQPLSPTSAAKKQPFLRRIFGSNSSNYNSRKADVHVASYGGGGHRRRTASMHY